LSIAEPRPNRTRGLVIHTRLCLQELCRGYALRRFGVAEISVSFPSSASNFNDGGFGTAQTFLTLLGGGRAVKTPLKRDAMNPADNPSHPYSQTGKVRASVR